MASDPTATAVHPELSRFITHFFSALEPAVRQRTQRGLEGLANLKILAGVYVQAPAGATASHFGRQVPITGLLRIAKGLVKKSGANYSTADVVLTQGQFVEQDLCYLQELGDAVTDDAATLRRVLADVESGPAWAPAIAGAPDRQAAFGKLVYEIDRVPAGGPSTELAALQGLLARHFTYDDDGAYFAKWAGAGRQFPANVSDDYKDKALREVPVIAGEVYCLAVVPARMADGAADERAMREFLVRIGRVESDAPAAPETPGAPAGGAAASDEPLTLESIYSVPREPRAAGQAAFHQFCFFHTMAGEGVAIPDSAASALGERVTALLSYLPSKQHMQRYAQAVRDPDYFFTDVDETLKVRLFATVRPGARLQNLPAGVELQDLGEGPPESGEPDVRLALCPPEQIVALGAHADIEQLEPVKAVRLAASKSRTDLKVPGLTTALTGAGLRGDGDGSMIGIIDSGIDGSHPAFTGRIHAVWDQTLPRNNPPPFAAGNFGEVLTGANVATAVDTDGHGTHVAGIAAGAPSPPGYTQTGIAPRARLIMVRLRDLGDDNIVAGARWIFQQAQAAGRPCVINMSFGGRGDDHDGTDPLIVRLRGLIRTGAGFTPGRLLVAAAGNERGFGMHTHVASLGPVVRTPDEIARRVAFRRENHPEATAQFELFVRPGLSPQRPIEIQIFGTPIAPATRCDLAVRIELMPGGGANAWTGFLRQQPNNNFHTRRVANTRVRISNGRRPPLGIGQSRPLIRLERRRAGLPINTGVWRITIVNDGPGAAEVHAYALQSRPLRLVFFRAPTESFLIDTPANGDGIIAVASTVNRATWPRSDGKTVTNERSVFDATGQLTGSAPEVAGAISSFSSPGPVRRTNRTIDATAPGGALMSARSNQMFEQPAPDDMIDALTRIESGTSQAAPVVTGIAACLFERRRALTYPEFQQWLRDASAMPAGGSADDFGPGIIDASKPPLLLP